jgi:ubiquinone/menaquinone biosynthesis C-methylase UbiE
MSADSLDYPDSSFDLVFSLDVIHNLEPKACDQAILEMMRVSCGHCFLQIASYNDEAQLQRLREWGVTVQTFRSQGDWLSAFARLGYAGDYCFKTF